MAGTWAHLRLYSEASQRAGTFALSIQDCYGHMYAYLLISMLMRRTALFLKEEQLVKLQTLSDKTGAPLAELVRRAIDAYLLSRRKELK